MTDKPPIELETRPQDPISTIAKDNSSWTSEELNSLGKFMHESFPYLEYGQFRDKGIIVEYPPDEVCSHEEWQKIMDSVLKPEIGVLDPSLMRQHKIIIRFVDKLTFLPKNEGIGGNALSVMASDEKEWWIRVKSKGKSQEHCSFVLMHELFEVDFWSKTSSEEAKNLNKEEVTIGYSDFNSPIYRHLLDEKIASRRALRAVRRMWPSANWEESDMAYEEDK